MENTQRTTIAAIPEMELHKAIFRDVWNFFQECSKRRIVTDQDWDMTLESASQYSRKYEGTPYEAFTAEMLTAIMKHAEKKYGG